MLFIDEAFEVMHEVYIYIYIYMYTRVPTTVGVH